MHLDELAYIVIGSAKLDEWKLFASHLMGAMVEDAADGGLFIRIDDWHYRVQIVPRAEERFLCAGWCVEDRAAWDAALAEARDHGVDIRIGTTEDCEHRMVSGLFGFTDPGGNAHEVCWGRSMTSRVFVSPTGVGGFVTGDLGMGHVVLPCSGDFDATLAFYETVMGLTYSDYFVRRTSIDGPLRRAYFMHCRNSRQHSLAIVEMEDPTGLLHFMTEVRTIDDVGRAMDGMKAIGAPLARSLGRHVNDSVVSFYVVTPSGFHLEYGYGGERMDWSHHQVRQITNGTYWGHEWQPGIFVVAPSSSAEGEQKARNDIEARKNIPS